MKLNTNLQNRKEQNKDYQISINFQICHRLHP